jgi:hypothetical protein
MESREELSKGDIREKRITMLFTVICVIVFAFLFVFAFMFSWCHQDIDNEHVYKTEDNILLNVMWLVVGLIIAWIIGKAAEKYCNSKTINIVAVAVGIICVLVSVYWINISKSCPRFDQEKIVEYAVAYKGGDTSSLLKGGYVSVHRQQLGLITFMRVLFLIAGQGNYKAFQYLTALMVFVIVYSGYRIIALLTEENIKAEAVFLALMLFCIPMYGYTPFVYGDLISTAFVMLGAWILLSAIRKFTWWKLAMLAVNCGLMLQLRRNTLIIAVAFILVVLVKTINHPDWRVLLGGAIIAGMAASQLVINTIYNPYIPEDSDEMPAILYVAMGTRDYIEYEPGWYDEYNRNTFRENDYDAKSATEAARNEIGKFIDKCKESPKYALDFYTLKTNTQWNVPMYQCLSMNMYFDEELEGLAWEIYFNGKDVYLENFMNIYQLLIYGGVVLTLILMRKKWIKIENYVLLIGVYGGFLFSLIWEAKSRYILPYFIMMIPYAAIGITELTGKISSEIIRFSIRSSDGK